MLTWVETSLLRIKMDQPPVELMELTKNVSSTAETINIYDMVTISLIREDSSDFQGENSDLVESLCLCSCFCVFPPRKQQPARLWALHHTFPNTVRQLRTHARAHTHTHLHTHNLHDPSRPGRKQTGTHDWAFNGLRVWWALFLLQWWKVTKSIYSELTFRFCTWGLFLFQLLFVSVNSYMTTYFL